MNELLFMISWQTSRSCGFAIIFQDSIAFCKLSLITGWFSNGALEIMQRLKSIILLHSSTQNHDCFVTVSSIASQTLFSSEDH
jgi:hypothetical protein